MASAAWSARSGLATRIRRLRDACADAGNAAAALSQGARGQPAGGAHLNFHSKDKGFISKCITLINT